MPIRAILLSLCILLEIPAAGQESHRLQLESSNFEVGDEAFAPLLLRGFYPSKGKWSGRWAEKKFAARMERPGGPEPVYLVLQFVFTPEVSKAHSTIAIASRVNGVQLSRQTFSKTGAMEYVALVPEKAFTKAVVEVDFEVDHSIPLADFGNRDGSVIVYSIALRHANETLVSREEEIVLAREGYQYLLAKRDQVVPQKQQTELLKLFHEVPIWAHTFFHNVAIMKNPLDLWMMQQTMYEVQPEVVIETGTAFGGSALYWAHTLNGMGLDRSRVVTIDIQHACLTAEAHPLWKKYVTFFQGSSTDPEIVAKVAQMAKGKRTLVTLDSDHSMAHVLKEIELYAPMVSEGSYLVVEDTHLDGVPTLADSGPGPMAAVRRFLEQGGNRRFEQDFTREAYIMTFNPGGWLRRKQAP